MPKVSVIVPVYNTEQYLSSCLDAVLGQSLEDIEVICVNDGSADRSIDILNEYASRDRRITVVDQSNRGCAGARNAGIALATGEYLYFLDSDDFIDASTLAELYERASRHELDVLYFAAATFFEDAAMEAEYADFSSYYQRSGEYDGVMPGTRLLADMYENNDYKPSACLQMIRSEYFRSAGLGFYEGILHEDNLFSFLCILQAERVEYTSKPYYHRRVREGSIMTVERGAENLRGFLICHLEMHRFVVQAQLDARASAAAAGLCAEVFQQALRINSLLPKDEARGASLIDQSPEAHLAAALLARQRRDLRKIARLESALAACETRLERLKASRSYRLAHRLRALVRFGR